MNLKNVAYVLKLTLNEKIVILGVLKNETCYKTGRASTRDFTVSENSFNMLYALSSNSFLAITP